MDKSNFKLIFPFTLGSVTAASRDGALDDGTRDDWTRVLIYMRSDFLKTFETVERIEIALKSKIGFSN